MMQNLKERGYTVKENGPIYCTRDMGVIRFFELEEYHEK